MSVRWLPLGTLAAVLGQAPIAAAQVPIRITASDVTIAGIKPGADSVRVLQLLGRPDSATTGSDPTQAAPLPVWWYHDLEVVFLSSSHVLGAWIRGQSRSTARGLKLRATRADVLRLYGDPGPSQLIRALGPSAAPRDTSIVYYSARRDDAPSLFIYLSQGRVSAIYAGQTID